MMGKAKYSAVDIASWFLFYNNLVMIDTDADLISNLKLQKLLYYAQGCYLALKGSPLFKDPLLAWEHGPVVKKVYDIYKNYGSNGIPFEGGYVNNISPEDEAILKDVYGIFAKYSAWGLRNMTHQEAPWKDTPLNKEIPIDSIKKYFIDNYLEK